MCVKCEAKHAHLGQQQGTGDMRQGRSASEGSLIPLSCSPLVVTSDLLAELPAVGGQVTAQASMTAVAIGSTKVGPGQVARQCHGLHRQQLPRVQRCCGWCCGGSSRHCFPKEQRREDRGDARMGAILAEAVAGTGGVIC